MFLDAPRAPGILFDMLRARVDPQTVRGVEHFTAVLALHWRVFSGRGRLALFAVMASMFSK